MEPPALGLAQGARRTDVTEVSKGYASMGGTFKLTFKGHSTDSISYNADASDIQVGNVGISLLHWTCKSVSVILSTFCMIATVYSASPVTSASYVPVLTSTMRPFTVNHRNIGQMKQKSWRNIPGH